MKPKKMFLGGLFSSKKKDDDKPMTMTQKKAEEAKKRARTAQMRSESKARRGRTASTTAVGGAKKPPARKTGSFTNPAEVKKRNTARFQDKSEALRKEALKKGAPEIKKARFLAESERLRTAALAKDAAENKKGTVTGKGGRNVGTGRNERANVTREQLKDSGMTLRQYLNFMDREGKRPPKKAMGGGMMKSKMKAKGMKAGGKTPFPDLNKDGKVTQKDILMGRGVVKKKAGGAMKSKGYAKGGAMKTKGYKAGGKVRGAGIARKGVRPAKIR